MSEWISEPTREENSTPANPRTEAGTTRNKRRPPPSSKLIRHVLRARLDAARLLAPFLAELERSGVEVRASSHLAQARSTRQRTGDRETAEDFQIGPEPRGWRDAREVVQFLRKRGAKIGDLGCNIEGHWAAASDGEGESLEDTANDIVWVPPGQPL